MRAVSSETHCTSCRREINMYMVDISDIQHSNITVLCFLTWNLTTKEVISYKLIFFSQYYYSIKDISVGGMCICYGHAQSCPLDPVTKVMAHTCTPVHQFTWLTVHLFTCTPAHLLTCSPVHLFTERLYTCGVFWQVMKMVLCGCVNRNCSVCVNTTLVERAVTSVAPVTTNSHGNQEPFQRETLVKVRKWTEK